MPHFVLISLYEQSQRLADDLFEIAVVAVDRTGYVNFDKVCNTLEHALQRVRRREEKAGLVFHG